MMFNKLSILAMGAALANLASAVGRARIVNKCDFNVYAWSVGSNIAGPYTLAKQGGNYGEVFTRDPETGGRALKVTKEADGLYTGKPQTIFAYNLDGNAIWYDLSDVFGDGFVGHKLVVASSGCPSIVWENGTPPAGSQVKNCDSGPDVILTLCA